MGRSAQTLRYCLRWLPVFAAFILLAPSAHPQARPYIGFVYPAGGERGTTFQVRFGGQNMDYVSGVLVTGTGVTGKVAEYYRRLDNQEMDLLNEQLKELKRATSGVASAVAPTTAQEDSMMMMSATAPSKKAPAPGKDDFTKKLIARIEARNREYQPTPACASISTLAFVEVSIAPNAEPGPREIRLATFRGISNPLTFYVGQAQEFTRKPMLSATIQVLGKEARALRKRPVDEVEDRVTLPCTVNGQIASGEVNRYRFDARQGQRLIFSTQGRQLIPYIADAVPGWFQPVLVLYDAKGKEVAFDDDYRFKPDPVILYEVPKDGEYVCAIYDSVYRGREDFVYRISIGELPFVTSLFPLGRQAGATVSPKMKGWNVDGAELTPPPADAPPGIYSLTARRNGLVSDPVPFAVDALPDTIEKEPNNTQAGAQAVTLPIIVNGRIDAPGDWDVFQFSGKSNDTVVAEVQARRLDSPLDSVIKLTDATGQLLAFSDDREDLGAGVNTHQADSWFVATLPADGDYFVHIGDTARQGGEEYAYRLRISAPQPDFALRVVPSSFSIRSKATAPLTAYAIRKDGFTGPIKIGLKDPPAGFSATPITLLGTQTLARLTVKTELMATKEPLHLFVQGSAKIGETQVVHEAVPAEDRMQAFLWRHLVPTSDPRVVVFPTNMPPPMRLAPFHQPPTVRTNMSVASAAIGATNAAGTTNIASLTNLTAVTNIAASTETVGRTSSLTGTNAVAAAAAAKAKFTKQQIAGRLRQLKRLYEEELLTDAFYNAKVAECDTAQ